jgi:hypothetical protein
MGGSGRAVPQALGPVLAHCLEKNPEDRFQSARDLIFALQVVERDVDSAAAGDSVRRVRVVGGPSIAVPSVPQHERGPDGGVLSPTASRRRS